jgi:hypothetical protein
MFWNHVWIGGCLLKLFSLPCLSIAIYRWIQYPSSWVVLQVFSIGKGVRVAHFVDLQREVVLVSYLITYDAGTTSCAS